MSLEKKAKQLEKVKTKMLKSIESYSYEQLNHKKDEQTWSIAQVISHILDAEIGIQPYISKRLQEPKRLKKTGFKNALNSMLLATVFKSRRKFKAPKEVSTPANDRSFEELSNSWAEGRVTLIETLLSVPKDMQNKALWRHPVAGELNITQVFDFFINHIVHHEHQIKRISKGM